MVASKFSPCARGSCRNFALVMKIDSKFFDQQWYKAIATEFGPAGQIAVIRMMISIYESPQGYWRSWKLVDCYEIIDDIPGLTLEVLDKIVDRLAQYEIFDRNCLKSCVLTSKYLQREFIRQCGVARARRLKWRDYPMLTPQELLDMGVIPAVDESLKDGYGQPFVTADEPFGKELPLPSCHPLHSSERRCVRVSYRDTKLHVYRLVGRRRRSQISDSSSHCSSASSRRAVSSV